MKNPAKALSKYIANYGRTVTLSADGKPTRLPTAPLYSLCGIKTRCILWAYAPK